MSANSYDKYKRPKHSCNKPLTGDNWCKHCNSKHFEKEFGTWTSDNNHVDELIQKTQTEANDHNKVLEWIRFKSKEIFCVGFLAEGGNGHVYKAKWKSGPIEYYDEEVKGWHRSGEIDIVLKSIKDSKDITDEFFEEIKQQMTSFRQFSYIIRCYGITKIPDSDNYMMIMDYKKDGSLRKYLDKNFRLLKWRQKLNILYTAIKGLLDIHKADLMHKDFHSGNIIISDNFSYIADFGLCKSVNSNAQSHPPYHTIPHDQYLMIDIAKGRRPVPNEDITPPAIINLIERCWNENPNDRPDANELFKTFSSFMQKESEIQTKFDAIDAKMNSNISSPEFSPSLTYTISKDSIYTSRHLILPELSIPFDY
ncbi:19424_t:CDS:2 [Cetraspora pellucida]|uniref:19424_t:CDS:1 n=1 Tax=Cetraspora pellucida TaxID=1433469 RepID=A0A9N9DUH2_9GLOM|nr:19424_t:CDS:2 [Cetraspora pellucida]